jgi:LysR family transcriptional regulator, mexEF-oprN operon transcriptional activator
MHESNFRGLDLNLLVVFAVIFRERSVTRAADRLGLSQSAVSPRAAPPANGSR